MKKSVPGLFAEAIKVVQSEETFFALLKAANKASFRIVVNYYSILSSTNTVLHVYVKLACKQALFMSMCLVLFSAEPKFEFQGGNL